MWSVLKRYGDAWVTIHFFLFFIWPNKKTTVLDKNIERVNILLSHNIASESEITLCNKIDKPLVV